MLFKYHPNGFYFQLESKDMKDTAWKDFINAVKKLKTASYGCPELEGDDPHYWFIGKPDAKTFFELKEFHIDRHKHDNAQLRAEGYRPIPRRNQFCRKRIV